MATLPGAVAASLSVHVCPFQPSLSGDGLFVSIGEWDRADWRDLCHFMPWRTGSRCTVPKQVFMLPALRRQWGGEAK